MEDLRFFFGASFGAITVALLSNTEWAWYVIAAAYTALYIITRYFVHKITVS